MLIGEWTAAAVDRPGPCPVRGDVEPVRRRDFWYRWITRLLAAALLPVAALVAPGRARPVACRWALAARFPAADLAGLTAATRAAFLAASAEALWRDGALLGLTSGHRDADEQARLFDRAVRDHGPVAARRWVLPPWESRHVTGTAVDVRPREGARWLDRNGARFHLYRRYDNEWWHFEYSADGPPARLPHPGHVPAGASMRS
jgi:D-alanyl-D-alanine carboxypeptidase